jgi:hypothetical protein
MATLMKSHAVAKRAWNVGDPQPIMEELAQLKETRGEGIPPR